jgi:hypothetical protein
MTSKTHESHASDPSCDEDSHKCISWSEVQAKQMADVLEDIMLSDPRAQGATAWIEASWEDRARFHVISPERMGHAEIETRAEAVLDLLYDLDAFIGYEWVEQEASCGRPESYERSTVSICTYRHQGASSHEIIAAAQRLRVRLEDKGVTVPAELFNYNKK